MAFSADTEAHVQALIAGRGLTPEEEEWVRRMHALAPRHELPPDQARLEQIHQEAMWKIGTRKTRS